MVELTEPLVVLALFVGLSGAWYVQGRMRRGFLSTLAITLAAAWAVFFLWNSFLGFPVVAGAVSAAALALAVAAFALAAGRVLLWYSGHADRFWGR